MNSNVFLNIALYDSLIDLILFVKINHVNKAYSIKNIKINSLIFKVEVPAFYTHGVNICCNKNALL